MESLNSQIKETAFTKGFVIPKNVKVLSFDVFDTLLLRPFEKPNDVFSFIAPHVEGVLQKGQDFTKLRKQVERETRQKALPVEEVTIDEIYANFTQIPPKTREEIKLREIEMELKFCFPRKSGEILYKKAVESGLIIVATSDIYFEEEFLAKLLKKNGFKFDFIFSSASLRKRKKTGNIYPEITRILGVKPEEILHVGDNKISDITRAKEHGLQTFYLPLLRSVLYENPHYKRLFKGKRKCLLTMACIGAMCERLDLQATKPSNTSLFSNNIYEIGFSGFGGILYAYTTWAYNLALKHNIKKLVFIARDGFIMQKMFQILYGNSGIESVYLECSRRSLACFEVETSQDLTKIFAKKYRNTSIENFIKEKLECDPAKIAGNIREFGFSSMQEKVKHFFKRKSDETRLEKVVMFYSNKLHSRIQKEKENAMKFLENSGILEDDVGFCDVGYAGTTQRIISKLKTKGEVFGFYMLTNHHSLKLKHSFGFLGNAVGKLKFKFFASIIRLIETIIFSAPFGTVNHYNEKGKPILEDLQKQEEKRLKVNEEVWQGMLDLGVILKKRFGDEISGLTYTKTSIANLFAEFAIAPEEADAKLLKGVVFENKSNAGGYRGLIEDNLWKMGALSVKQPLLYKLLKPFLRKLAKKLI